METETMKRKVFLVGTLLLAPLVGMFVAARKRRVGALCALALRRVPVLCPSRAAGGLKRRRLEARHFSTTGEF
jgi:hypothetical protein